MPDLHALIPVTIAAAFFFGVLLTLPGSLRSSLATHLGLDATRVGSLLSAWNIAWIGLLLFAGILVDVAGIRSLIIVGSLLATAALATLAISRSYMNALYALLVAGAGGACLAVSAMVLMPRSLFDDNPAASVNLGTVFYGLGALITPALIDVLIHMLRFRRTLYFLAVCCLVPAVLTAWLAHPSLDRPAEPALDPWLMAANPLIWIAGLVLVFYLPLEGSLSTWAAGYLTEQGYPPRRASRFVLGFWLTFLAARLLIGFLQAQDVLPRNSEAWLILGLALAAAVALGNLTGTRAKVPAGAGLLFMGLLLGPIFPTLIGLVFENVDMPRRGTAFGIVVAIGSAGSLLLPPLMGRYARRHSIRAALRIPTLIALVLAVTTLVLALTMGSI